jgi:hypothetical protein
MDAVEIEVDLDAQLAHRFPAYDHVIVAAPWSNVALDLVDVSSVTKLGQDHISQDDRLINRNAALEDRDINAPNRCWFACAQ